MVASSQKGATKCTYHQCLNPLHCGAVVASSWAWEDRAHGQQVSIPFIAGQWSLPPPPRTRPPETRRVSIPFIAGQWSLPAEEGHHGRRISGSQSPSLRGSGRFEALNQRLRHVLENGLNPLHCGAVVASLSLRPPPRLDDRVSIPFIAGQWSLPAGADPRGGGYAGLNPLHCGAVVASRS